MCFLRQIRSVSCEVPALSFDYLVEHHAVASAAFPSLFGSVEVDHILDRPNYPWVYDMTGFVSISDQVKNFERLCFAAPLENRYITGNEKVRYVNK